MRRFKPTPLPEGALERLLDLASIAPSVGLSQPWRFVVVESAGLPRGRQKPASSAATRRRWHRFCGERAALYARLKLAGLNEAPCQFAVFADRTTEQGHGLGRLTMPATIDYSAVMAVHTLWLAARAEGIGMGWVSILDPVEMADDPRHAARMDADRLLLRRLPERGARRADAGTRGLGVPAAIDGHHALTGSLRRILCGEHCKYAAHAFESPSETPLS